MSCGSERTQPASQRGREGLHDRLRPMPAAKGGALAGRQPRAAAPLSREGYLQPAARSIRRSGLAWTAGWLPADLGRSAPGPGKLKALALRRALPVHTRCLPGRAAHQPGDAVAWVWRSQLLVELRGAVWIWRAAAAWQH